MRSATSDDFIVHVHGTGQRIQSASQLLKALRLSSPSSKGRAMNRQPRAGKTATGNNADRHVQQQQAGAEQGQQHSPAEPPALYDHGVNAR